MDLQPKTSLALPVRTDAICPYLDTSEAARQQPTRWKELRRAFIIMLSFVLILPIHSISSQQKSGALRANSFTVLITFGLKDDQPKVWDGQVRIEGGELTQTQGYRFVGNKDRIVSIGTWKISTQVERKIELPSSTSSLPQPESVRQAPEGVIIFGVATSPSVKFDLTSAQGGFSFTLADLNYGRPLSELAGEAQVELLPASTNLSESGRNADDFPSIAVGHNGTVWAVWASFDGARDEIPIRQYRNGQWLGKGIVVPGASGDIWLPQVAVDGANHPWVVWSQQVHGNWDLYASEFDSNSWRGPLRLTEDPNPDINHQLIADRAGNLWIVWQSFRFGNSDIYLKYFKNGKWSRDIQVTNDSANEWDPSIAVDKTGRAHIVWDTYRNGNYDVYMRSYDNGSLSPEIAVATTPRFEARATVTTDNEDRVWVAWEVGGSQWGKDRGETIRDHNVGSTLYGPRSIGVRCFVNGIAKEPVSSIPDDLPQGANNFLLSPRLTTDQQGRIWLLFLHFFSNSPSFPDAPEHIFESHYWEEYVTSYQGNAWSTPVRLPKSWNRLSSRASLAAGSDSLWLAWPTDNRTYDAATVPVSNQVYMGRVEFSQAQQSPVLVDAPPALSAQKTAADVRETDDVKTVRSYRVMVAGKRYRILRGDLHRHTEFSWDVGGDPDGSVPDFYRYMLDAASMDFGAVTDHMSGGGYPYWIWLTEKLADLYHVPDVFQSLFGYERSVTYPFGHHNIICDHRGVPIVPFNYNFGPQSWVGVQAQASETVKNDSQLLYKAMHDAGCIAIPHTTADVQGTNWQDYDPDVEPVVEIYQGNRFSSEHPGAPRTAVPDKDGLEHIDGEYFYLDTIPLSNKSCCDYVHLWNVAVPYEPKGFVWNAWAKGYKLGVEASSDHVSTHISYTMVYVEQPTRKGVMDALKHRHVYGATDNILLDVRIGAHLMGDSFVTHRPSVRLHVKAIGTDLIAKVNIIGNNTYLYSNVPDRRSVNFNSPNQDLKNGLNYFYVRLEQKDGQLAWSSPIWVEYQH